MPLGGNMTGMYLRVKRENSYENIEIEYLTHDELNELFKDKEPTELIRWIIALSSVIRNAAGVIYKEENNATN